MSVAAKVKRPLLLGHRGARAFRSIPENTIESFERALADGCDGFEFDVRLTGDGKAVICHDPRVKGIEIAKASARELPSLPDLEDVLSRFHKRAFLDIELKVRGLEHLVTSLLKRYPPVSGFVVSSFLPEVLRALRSASASVTLGLICETVAEFQVWSEVPIGYVMPHYSLLSQESVAMLKAGGKQILVWTVNNGKQMKKYRELEVDGIISDDTELLAQTFSD